MPTSAHLGFQLDHARARDAVHTTLEIGPLLDGLQARALGMLHVRTAAVDRAEYVRRPDLGRLLDPDARPVLEAAPRGHDVGIVVADGLSATAVHANTLPLLDALLPALGHAGLGVGPVVVAEGGRVAIGDPVGDPGLRCSRGVDLRAAGPERSRLARLLHNMAAAPRSARLAPQLCLEHPPRGLSYEAAAGKIAYLITEARRRRISGVMLKEDAPPLLEQGPETAGGMPDTRSEDLP